MGIEFYFPGSYKGSHIQSQSKDKMEM